MGLQSYEQAKHDSQRLEKLRKERRIAAVYIDINIFGDLITAGTPKLESEGLPENAIFVSADKDVMRNSFVFLYAHEDFVKIEEGHVIPSVSVMLTRHEEGGI